MPWQQREIIQFCLILLCVPLQYYITGYFDDVKDNDRSQIIIRIMKGIDSAKEKLLNMDLWTVNWHDLMLGLLSEEDSKEYTADSDDTDDDAHVKRKTSARGDEENDQDEYDVILEMLKIRNKRPISVLYRIGQTVQLVDHAYRGIIIGWDNDKTLSEPIYSILLDESHFKSDMLSVIIQVQQTKLYVIKNYEMTHKHLKRYFKVYDGSQYLPRKWLKKLYPKD